MIYFFLIFILIILSVNHEITGFNKGKKILIFIIIFILAFNYQMGTDWISYQYFYENIIPNISFFDIFNKKFNFEKGYILINFLFYNLGFNYEMFIGTILGICSYILLNIIHKKSDNYYLSFAIFAMLYLIITALEPVIRQLIAITLISYAYKYIEKRKIFSYLIFIFIAFFFHKSAVIGFFIYFIPLIKINLKNLIFVIIGSYIFISYMPTIFKIFLKYSSSLSRYSYYFNSIKYGISQQRSILGNIYNLIILCGYIYIIFYCYQYSKKKSDLYKNMAVIYALVGYFQNLLPIFYRVNLYFTLGFSVCMGSVAKLHTPNNKIIKINHKKIGFLFIIILYFPFILGFSRILLTELNKVRYLNYKNYFIEMVKGTLKKDFKEKRNGYEKIIEKLIEKENNTLRRE